MDEELQLFIIKKLSDEVQSLLMTTKQEKTKNKHPPSKPGIKLLYKKSLFQTLQSMEKL